MTPGLGQQPIIIACYRFSYDFEQLTVLVLYRLYFHPLAKYPGPFLARITNWYAVYHAYIGDKHLQNYWAHKKYGKFVRMAPNMVTINDPEAIKEIYGVNKNVRKSQFYQPAIAHAGLENMFNARDRDLHARKRRILAPAFTEASLRSMEQYILPHIDEALEVASGQQIYQGAGECWTTDLAKWSNYLTFDIMGDLVFGRDFGMVSGRENQDLPLVIDSALHRQLLAGSSAFMHKWGLDKLLFPGIVQRGSQLLIYARKQAQMRKAADPSRKDFFWYIDNAKEKNGAPAYDNPREVFSEARTLIIGGSDTTATQLAASFFYLTNNPQTLSRLASEIRGKFKSFDDIRLGQQLDDCKYLQAVVNETLRISPSLPGVLPREVLPGGLTVLGETFPAGVELSMPIYALHHNDEVYFEPHRYIPERWLPECTNEDVVSRCSDSLAPFSYGSRQCIGKRLAMIELYLALARSVWRYDLQYVCGGKDDRFGDNLDIVEYKLLDHMAAGRHGPLIRFWRRAGS
ncbi:benzoate 4-monooxygenase cytochrome-like protein P450 [Rhizodiscina lignyota]|uniref:Benzoate 4-monooxygenase cytochrome-like protein P450 n=1 Tax=Rhizodiscina lignyota TaxID=1504668 RepID=A0A9P4I7X6_9PEZI|nr:benzoate 4-monooxygenase cytochrome-like protein P450 [Rhizodiscina lignyota]